VVVTDTASAKTAGMAKAAAIIPMHNIALFIFVFLFIFFFQT
jgi:hypothetical protein